MGRCLSPRYPPGAQAYLLNKAIAEYARLPPTEMNITWEDGRPSMKNIPLAGTLDT